MGPVALPVGTSFFAGAILTDSASPTHQHPAVVDNDTAQQQSWYRGWGPGVTPDPNNLGTLTTLGGGIAGNFMVRVDATNSGATQQTPMLPVSSGGQFLYQDVASGLWFDPATASAFDYKMTSGSLFTGILNFPTGFANAFTVTAGGVVLGSFSPGQNLTFPGGGVPEFMIAGINPLVDPSDPSAFPLQLSFNTATASFTQQPVPEPDARSLGLIGTMLLAAAARSRRRNRVRSS
jgi:hypothetical protein